MPGWPCSSGKAAGDRRERAWLVHLILSLPAGTTVAAVSGGAGGSCRIRRDGLRCDWGEVPGRSALGLSVTVRLGPRISAGTTLTTGPSWPPWASAS